MKTQFRCPSCGKRMSADSRFAGRTVPCPICGAQILIPTDAASTPAPEASPSHAPASASPAGANDDFDLAADFELLASESDAPASEATGTITSTGAPASTSTATATTTATATRPPNAVTAGRYFISPPFPFQPPTPDPADPMASVYPCYAPNPFATSFPLDQAAPNGAAQDEEDEEPSFASKMPSVDELIN